MNIDCLVRLKGSCRAGTTTPFHFGDTITTELANYNGPNSYGSGPQGIYLQKTTPVGNFRVANAFGLYDMHGNVGEWCADHKHNNYNDAPTDGSAWISENGNQDRLTRGGSWLAYSKDCRSASRHFYTQDKWTFNIGFRVICAQAWTL